MNKSVFILFIISCFALVYACTEPFDFEAKNYERVLVIEASISNEFKKHPLILSYTYELNGGRPEPNVTNAEVFVMTGSGEKIPYVVIDTAYQSSVDFSGEVGEKYQLTVITADNKKYESSWEEMLPAPAIDSIYDKYVFLPSKETNQNEPGIQFFLDMHDETGKTKYYRYDWEETYQIKVPYPSFYEAVIRGVDSILTNRNPLIGVCYETKYSNTISVGSSNQSSTNSITEFPIRYIEQNNRRIRSRYSILVTQYAISEEAYLFYKKVIESSESSGSFFDKQLGTITGNMRSVDTPDEPVLGFFEVAGSTSLRTFFGVDDFDERFRPGPFWYQCFFDDAQLLQMDEAIPYLLLNQAYSQAFQIKSPPTPFGPDSVYIFPRTCTSCDWYAEIEQPDFWIE